MKPDDDDALRAAFAEAHRTDATRMPSFDHAWRNARRGSQPRASPLAWLVTCATLVTAAVCPCISCTSCPVAASQMRTELSTLPVMTFCPSAEKTAVSTAHS